MCVCRFGGLREAERVPPLPQRRPLTLGLLMLYEGLLFPSVLHLHQATSIFQIA